MFFKVILKMSEKEHYFQLFILEQPHICSS